MSSRSEVDTNVIHDNEVASILYRIVTAPVIYMDSSPQDESKNQKIYELQVDLGTTEMMSLCSKMRKSFMQSSTLIRIDNSSPVIIIADLHGQIVHLLRILRTCGPPPTQRYLFLGDYVDRGVQGLLVITLLFCLKHRYPNHVYLLRGNHEDVNTTLNYGFYDECMIRWGVDEPAKGEAIWLACIEVFNTMPLAALIGSKVFCAHGGISPFMKSIDDIDKIKRPSIIPPFGLACDLLWSDPSQPERIGWSLSHRGISFTYGHDVAEEFCRTNDIVAIIRGHQLFKELYSCGYIVRFGGRLISLFSAINYENHRNNAAVIKVMFRKNIELVPIVFRCRHYEPQKAGETISAKDLDVMRKAREEKKEVGSKKSKKSAKFSSSSLFTTSRYFSRKKKRTK